MTKTPCELEVNYAFLASYLMRPEEGPRDPVLEYVGCLVLQTAFKKYNVKSPQDMEKVYTFIKNASSQEYRDFFKETEADPYLSSNFIAEATRLVIVCKLGSFLQSLHFSSPHGENLFSINLTLKQGDKKDENKNNG
jgi:hypothetical protein